MKALAMLYSGRSAIARGDIKEAQKWLLLSEPYMNTKNQGPITRLQYAMLLASSGTESLRRAQEICLSIYSEWLGVRDNAQLALYAEMIPLNVELSNRTGDNSYIDRAMSIADWYVSMQCDDGSFPLAPQKHLPYTRGTGKIIEALATIPKRYREVIRRSFRYLGSMQYTQSSTYHIASNMEGDFLGGFRHDALDRDSWIDGAAHVVLAVARWRKFH